ncbi:MAG: histidine phosphatase family protein [Flavobacteriales bacterium]|nr:MAG: histidine phosphatase family protein [Flavobacteriales bacterium]
MKPIRILFPFLLLLLFANCKEDQKIGEINAPAAVSTYYFIRHAEKDRSDPENTDPELDQSGLGRAMHWAEILKDVPLHAIYSTDYTRTSMTAAPTSVKMNVDVQYYDPQTIDIAQFKQDNLGRSVLVVGHSNTTPDFVNKMIGEDKYAPMDDTDNGSLFIVQIVDGVPTSQRLHFSCNCPKRK